MVSVATNQFRGPEKNIIDRQLGNWEYTGHPGNAPNSHLSLPPDTV